MNPPSPEPRTFGGRNVVPVPREVPKPLQFHLFDMTIVKRGIDGSGQLLMGWMCGRNGAGPGAMSGNDELPYAVGRSPGL